MPYAVIVSSAEGELVRAIWGDEGSPTIKATGNLLYFDPRQGKRISTAVGEFTLPDSLGENVRRRLLERIAALCGPSLLEQTSNPIASEPETTHKEDNEADAEAVAEETS